MAGPIAAVRVDQVALPFREPYTFARGEILQREIVLLELTTSSGAIGLGESAALSLRAGASAATIASELALLAPPCLVGLESERLATHGEEGWSLAAIRDALTALEAAGASRQALCAVDLALHDLAGRVAGEPVCRLLGAEPGEVMTNATLTAERPQVAAAAARAWCEDGFDHLKLKVGTDDDVEMVAAVRAQVGPEPAIAVDANASWDLETARRRLDAMTASSVALAEQPVVSVEELGTLAAELEIAIAADESVVTPTDAAGAVAAGVTMATAKLAKCGGIQAALAVSRRIPSWISSALDGPLGIAAGAHVALALAPNDRAPRRHGLATQRLLDAWPATLAAELDGPRLTVFDRPGLGVEIDYEAISELRIP